MTKVYPPPVKFGADRFAGLCITACRANKLPFFASLIFGLLAYVFAFTNKLPNHDEAGQLFGKGATFDSGRFGLEILEKVFPNYSMPWIYGIITIFLISIAICFLVRIFSVQNRIFQVLLSGCVMVFPSLIGLFGYMFTSTSYAVSFLMAVLSVWFIRKASPFLWFFGLVCLIFSLSIYQAYISVAASLLVLLLIQALLHGEKPGMVVRKGIFFFLFLIAALGGYYAANQLVMNFRGVTFNDYAADSLIFSISSLPQGIVEAYTQFYRFLTWRTHGLIPTEFGRKIHNLLFLVFFIMLVFWLILKKQKNPWSIGLLLMLLGLLPLAVNCMYLITTPSAVHTLVLYSFVSIYLLTLLLADAVATAVFSGRYTNLLRCFLLDLTALLLAVIIGVNTYAANQSYLNLHLKYENAYSFFTALMSDLRELPEFDSTHKLALAGTYAAPDFYDYYFAPVLQIMGIDGFYPTNYTNASFLEYYIGISIPMADSEEIQSVMQTPEYEAMAVYPYHGSIQAIGDLIVVKFS